jgi:hypothetical protein
MRRLLAVLTVLTEIADAARSTPDVTRESLLAGIPSSRLPSHPL